jgi:hypothetical protein
MFWGRRDDGARFIVCRGCALRMQRPTKNCTVDYPLGVVLPKPLAKCKAGSKDKRTVFMITVAPRSGKYACKEVATQAVAGCILLKTMQSWVKPCLYCWQRMTRREGSHIPYMSIVGDRSRPKNWVMRLYEDSARYSLVKGERIVRQQS